MKRPLILIGAGGHAAVIADILQADPRFTLVGCTGAEAGPAADGATTDFSVAMLGGDDVLEEWLARDSSLVLFLAIGAELVEPRRRAVAWLDQLGDHHLTKAVHPAAVIARSASLGVDTAVMAGAVVNPWATIGRHCIINTGATVDHHARIADNVFVQPGARLAGHVTVGEGAVIGLGASVRERIHIGRNAYVAGGAFVHRDVPDEVVVGGVPAQILSDRRRPSRAGLRDGD